MACDRGLITEAIEDSGKEMFCFDSGSECRPLAVSVGDISVPNYR